jgi:hypothetical protein
MKSFFIASAFTLASSLSYAQINFNSLSYSGTGCPQGTVSQAVSPDGSSLSILFDEFRAEVPQYDGLNDNNDLPRGPRARTMNSPFVSHKKCSLSFNATLPPGMRADMMEISMEARGATILDEGAEATFSSILVGYNGLARSRGNPTVVAAKNWRTRRGPVDDNWTETPKSVVEIKSDCAGSAAKDIRFDLKNHITAEIANGDVKKRALITVDSNDVKGLLTFTLRTTRCSGSRMSP